MYDYLSVLTLVNTHTHTHARAHTLIDGYHHPHQYFCSLTQTTPETIVIELGTDVVKDFVDDRSVVKVWVCTEDTLRVSMKQMTLSCIVVFCALSITRLNKII